jgi:predicted transcriptional regulator|tara:strand:+ start:4400 stop:4852 length:453 start_codon:yes stop_codon:yes gene_type:complete
MNAARTLARLERALKDRNVSLAEFLAQHELSQSTFYKAKSTNNITAKVNKLYLTALRSFEPARADDGEDVAVEDLVNSPAHYKLADGGIECIDVMIQLFGQKRVEEYAEITAFKYAWREGKKGDSKTDKRKKIWYTRFAMGDDPRKSSGV